MRVGVDIGGTFTDLVLNRDGELTIHKLPSTPHNPALAMLAGLNAITHHQTQNLERVAHGSTVATNAILERKGAKTALITTQGFRDVLFIGRQNRPDLYALQPQLPPPLIPRELCYDVPERLDHHGNVLIELDMDALDAVIDDLAAKGVDSVAVCLLYSFVNPAHEQAIRERIVSRGVLEAWRVALSCEVLPEFREYERASTLALEAYVRPVMGRYIGQLESELPENVGLRIMKSDGGVISAGRVKQQAIQTALSGPAAGVIGAFHVAKLAGYDHIITLDMGGTSTDVAVCAGAPLRRPQSEIDGLPLRIRLLDIETIGAGGGSMARVDAGGALRVGPESAGADPGPACYGRGGTVATVSDANAVLGLLDPDHFLGGSMTLHVDAAQATVGQIASAMNSSLEVAAQGILDVANVNIDRALRRVSVARGYDPRNFTLVTFGGAGALHACAVAERLEIPRVLIPRYPGVLCAFGLLVADVALDYAASVLGVVDESTYPKLAQTVTEMVVQANTDLGDEGVSADERVFSPLVDMRYQGQAYELTLPFAPESDLIADFHAEHERTYGHALHGRAVEVVNLRLQATGVTAPPEILPEAESAHVAQAIGEKIGANGIMLNLYERESLLPGAKINGAALVFQLDSTIYIAPEWSARVDGFRNLIVEKG
ncbi:MAG: hydantoinase/oxoprolinase family protein [Aggregatilineales bacterium]